MAIVFGGLSLKFATTTKELPLHNFSGHYIVALVFSDLPLKFATTTLGATTKIGHYHLKFWAGFATPNWTSWIAWIIWITFFHKLVTVTNFIWWIVLKKIFIAVRPGFPSIFPVLITEWGFESNSLLSLTGQVRSSLATLLAFKLIFLVF